jgi:malate dehydrogenase (oxaloacetate-decarboxylating)
METIPPSRAVDIPSGMKLLDSPLLNKGTAFSEEERTEFVLLHLLPPHFETLELQVERGYEAYRRKDDELDEDELRQRVMKTQWMPAYAALE